MRAERGSTRWLRCGRRRGCSRGASPRDRGERTLPTNRSLSPQITTKRSDGWLRSARRTICSTRIGAWLPKKTTQTGPPVTPRRVARVAASALPSAPSAFARASAPSASEES